MKNVFLNREALLAKPKLAIEKVEISNGFVYVREMTGYEKDIWEQSMYKPAPQGNMTGTPKMNYDLSGFRAKMAVCTLCDKDGNLLFTMNDVTLLSKSLKASDLEKIAEKAQALNSVSEKDKEEILKNLGAEQEKDSSSNSAEN